MTKDEIVASVIEDKPEYGVYSLVWGCVSKGGAWWANRPEKSEEFVWMPMFFISAPTCCTDQVVKKHVKKKSEPWQSIFMGKLVIIWYERGEVDIHHLFEDQSLWMYMMLNQEETGDWALALLEVAKK